MARRWFRSGEFVDEAHANAALNDYKGLGLEAKKRKHGGKWYVYRLKPIPAYA